MRMLFRPSPRIRLSALLYDEGQSALPVLDLAGGKRTGNGLRTSTHTGKNAYLYVKKALILSFVTFLLAAILFPLIFGADVAYAEDGKSEEELKEQLSQNVSDLIDRLGTEELDAYLNSLEPDGRAALNIENVREALRALVYGGSGDFFTGFVKLLASTFGRYFAGALPSFVTILVICLLNSLLGGLTSDFSGGSTREVVHIVCYSAIIVVLMAGIGSVVKEASDTISALDSLSSALFPVMLTLLSMLGGSVASATYTPYMATLSGVIMKLISVIILPAFVATIVFSVVGHMSKTVKLDKLTRLVKSASSWLIGIVFGLFGAFLTAQGISGGVADAFGFNVAKFALASYVPILGGYLSDGFDLLSASLSLVKNAVGYTGALLVIATALFPIIRIVIFSLAMRLTAGIAEPIGESRVASLMSELASNLNLLITAIAGTAFLFFVMLMLLIGTANYGI